MTTPNTTSLIGLVLAEGQLVTVSGCCPATLYADVVRQRAFAQAVPEYDTLVPHMPAAPFAAAAVKADWTNRAERLQGLIDRYLEQPEPLTLQTTFQTSLAETGVIITSPEPLSDRQKAGLGLFESTVIVESNNLATALTLWRAERHLNPHLTQWLWLSLDSHCTHDWLESQEAPYSPEFNTEGTLPGEALVVTLWRAGHAPGPVVEYANHQTAIPDEEADRSELVKGVFAARDARTALMAAADPTRSDRPPEWAECLTDDGFDEKGALIRYRTETAFWPKFKADPAMGPSEPFVSWSQTLGDIGLASLPVGLLLATHRQNHPMQPLDRVGVLVSDGDCHHFWQLRQSEATSNQQGI